MSGGNFQARPGSTIPLKKFLDGSGPRRLAAWILGVSAFAALFVTSFVGALHEPKPHHVPIAVVAPTPAAVTLQKRLDIAVPGGFTLMPYGSAQQAWTSLRDAAVDAVWISPPLPASGSEGAARPVARLFVASALGVGPTQVIEQTFTRIEKVGGATVMVRDLVPLRAQDPFGISSFFLSVGVFLPTFLGSIMLILLLRQTPALAMIAAIVVLAGSVALIDVTIVDAGLAALVGHFGTLVGIAALASLAFSAPIVAVGRLVGPIGALLALLVFVVLGLPASGGPFGTAFLPGFQRAFSPGLPLTNAVYAVRNASYFGSHQIGAHLVTLALWAGAGLLVLAAIAVSEASSGRTLSTSNLSSPPGGGDSRPLKPPRLVDEAVPSPS
jgi:hypothetical protein